MKALTIKQPWAELIARGAKRVENRTWGTHYRGRIAIHASIAKVTPCWRGEFGVNDAKISYGAVIATADIVDCLLFGTPTSKRLYPWLAKHEWASGPWCWVLAEVTRLRKPVPAKGKLGLWEWTP